jgi:hypothetical protein
MRQGVAARNRAVHSCEVACECPDSLTLANTAGPQVVSHFDLSHSLLMSWSRSACSHHSSRSEACLCAVLQVRVAACRFAAHRIMACGVRWRELAGHTRSIVSSRFPRNSFIGSGVCALALLATQSAACERGRSLEAAESATRPERDAAQDADTDASSASMRAADADGGARYPDACSDRQAARLRPCSTDPDPCGLHSGYAGDEYCLLPPPPGQGIQLHFGPRDYSDAAEIGPYLVLPGGEFMSYGVLNLPVGVAQSYAYVKVSMRPGSHHLISTLIAGHPPQGFVEPSAACGSTLLASFPSTTLPIFESPPGGVPAPENDGVARDLPDDASLCLNYHRFNDTDRPAISEAWFNIWFSEPSAVTQHASELVVDAGPFAAIAPHAAQTLRATRVLTGQGRILALFGHRHAATRRFSVFLNDALIYVSNDWSEPRRYEFDSRTSHPVIDTSTSYDGAASGMLGVSDGDRLRVECEVDNGSSATLLPGADLGAQEMCWLLVSSVGVTFDPGSL